jgi:serine/threonine-protein kinase
MSAAEAELEVRPGARVGPYEVMRRLSHGGMGSLYLARRMGPADFLRYVAIKVVHPHLAENKAFVRMFLDEARLSARIHHPNVVHVEDLGEVGGRYFLVMEYIHGTPLTNVLTNLSTASRRLRAEVAVAIAIGIADGLHAAHELRDEDGKPSGIVHRDVSPQNVLLSASGQVKLIDFGVAKARDRNHQSVTGSLKGKYAYMSPEQAYGREVDRRTDVYALGIVLWEMLTLKRMFQAENDIRVLEKVRNPRVPVPSAYAPGLPGELDRVVMRALARLPERRFESTRDLRLALLAAVPGAASVDATTLGTLVAATAPDELAAQSETLHSGVTSPSVAESISSAANLAPKQRATLIASMTVSAPRARYAPGDTTSGSGYHDSLAESLVSFPGDSVVSAEPAMAGLAETHETSLPPTGRRRTLLVASLALLAVIAMAIGGYLGVRATLSPRPETTIGPRDEGVATAPATDPLTEPAGVDSMIFEDDEADGPIPEAPTSPAPEPEPRAAPASPPSMGGTRRNRVRTPRARPAPATEMPVRASMDDAVAPGVDIFDDVF